MVSLDLLLSLAAASVVVYWYLRRRKLPNLPPGPPKLPLIGNLWQLPKEYEWETFAKWGEQFGSDIVYLELAGISFIVVNSCKIASDLFDKRSSKYSSRPTLLYAVSELIGWKWLFSTIPYGEKWRERRRLFQRHFHSSNSMIYQPQELRYTRELLAQLLDTPDKFMDHIRHAVGAVAISIAYGIRVLPKDDPIIQVGEQALIGLSLAAIPGTFLVDVFHFLRYVPEFMPGAGFQKKIREWRELTKKMLEVPFAVAQEEITNGLATPSFTSACLDRLDETSEDTSQRQVIKETAAAVFAGAADTTVSTINTFVLAMVLYPDVQAKAQHELDCVIGTNRLPEFGDESSLPYLSALTKEVLRWKPVTPIGVPHQLVEDDIYDGYHLPANSLVIGNAWAMLHNEKEYADPETFNPERFLRDGKLNPDVRDPATIAFGFGRRICPGSHIGMSNLWITAASILAIFNITKAVDESGVVIEPSQKYHSGLISHPLPFKCSIKPRSEEAAQLAKSFAPPVSSTPR